MYSHVQHFLSCMHTPYSGPVWWMTQARGMQLDHLGSISRPLPQFLFDMHGKPEVIPSRCPSRPPVATGHLTGQQ